MPKLARMSDVANLAGVSTMTVSRVLNANVNVSPDVSKRVLDAVKHLDYQRNEVARSLRNRRSRQIGILVPYLFDPFFASCAHVIGTVAQQHSYSVVLSTSNENTRLEFDEASRMVRRSVEGLIVIPAPLSDGAPSLFLRRIFANLPIVALDRPIAADRFDALLVQNRQGAKLGTQHLLALGHTAITFFGLSTGVYTMGQRERGFCDAMLDAGLHPTVVHLSKDLEETKSDVARHLAQTHRPTAIFCANNLLTRHVLHSLHDLNIHPPNPIALVGFDDFDTADILNPGITTVRQPVEDLGRIAAETLFNRLSNGSNTPTRETILPVDLIIRGSCGAGLPKQHRHLRP